MKRAHSCPTSSVFHQRTSLESTNQPLMLIESRNLTASKGSLQTCRRTGMHNSVAAGSAGASPLPGAALARVEAPIFFSQQQKYWRGKGAHLSKGVRQGVVVVTGAPRCHRGRGRAHLFAAITGGSLRARLLIAGKAEAGCRRPVGRRRGQRLLRDWLHWEESRITGA
jgi:hypothetical protein